MAFFGVTYGGDYALLHRSQPANQDIAFASMTPDRFEELFALHKLGSSSTAACLQIDGDTNMLRSELIPILEELLGRAPTKMEFDIFFTRFNFDGSCAMEHGEYRKAYTSLLEYSNAGGEQREWISYAGKRKDWMRHKRVAYCPQDSLVSDVKESQRIGWHVTKAGPPKDVFRPAGSTDVTQREGRSLADYYGTYTLMGMS